MDVADRVTVMNDGRQSGKPRDLYEHPANEFVMSFVGPVNRLGEEWIRPHDLELRLEPNGTTSEAMIQRIVHLGFEVRVELVLDDGRRVSAQVTRNEVEELELLENQIVYVARAGRRFSACRDQCDAAGSYATPKGCDVIAAISAGSSPDATSASVTSSSTARRFARMAIQTS